MAEKSSTYLSHKFWGVVFFVVLSASAIAQEYVLIPFTGLNIRTGPGKEFMIIAVGQEGELYHMMGEAEDWYIIKMFSDDYRYVSKRHSKIVFHSQLDPLEQPELPENEIIIEEMTDRIQVLTQRSKREANEIIPRDQDAYRWDIFRKVLNDQFILGVFRRFNVQPVMFGNLMGVAEVYSE